MAIEIFDFISRCPIFTLYIIIQIAILIADFIEVNFVRAFVHFWLGFMFFISYKEKLCSNNDINLGINQALMVLSFVFFQWFLIKPYTYIVTGKSSHQHKCFFFLLFHIPICFINV